MVIVKNDLVALIKADIRIYKNPGFDEIFRSFLPDCKIPAHSIDSAGDAVIFARPRLRPSSVTIPLRVTIEDVAFLLQPFREIRLTHT